MPINFSGDRIWAINGGFSVLRSLNSAKIPAIRHLNAKNNADLLKYLLVLRMETVGAELRRKSCLCPLRAQTAEFVPTFMTGPATSVTFGRCSLRFEHSPEQILHVKVKTTIDIKTNRVFIYFHVMIRQDFRLKLKRL